jgi:hypothetical protein
MKLSSPYVLPFAAFVPEGDELRAATELQIEVSGLAQPDSAVEALGSVVTAWEVLANTGALSGESLRASRSGIGDTSAPLQTSGRVTWQLSDVRVDSRASLVLLNLIATEWPEHRFAAVTLSLPGAELPLRLLHDPTNRSPYPGRDAAIAFVFECGDEVMEDVSLHLELVRRPTAEQLESLRESLATWAAVTACGAYGLPPNPPERCGLSFDPDDMELVDEDLDWRFAKFSAHPGALDGLANAVAALDQSGLGVRELRVR